MSRIAPRPESISTSVWRNADGFLVHPNAPAGGGGPGRFASAGVLGSDQSSYTLETPHPLSPCLRHRSFLLDGSRPALADARKESRVPSSRTKAVPASKTVTLNLTAKFTNPWKGNPKAELAAASPNLDKTLWHPTEDDWRASLEGQRSTQVATFKGFLEIIRQQAEGSIERINLLSHGMPELIGFGGKVTKDGGCFIDLPVAGGLDEKVIEFHEWKPLPPRGANEPLTYEEPLAVTAYKLRSRFVPDKAEICLYLCNAGVSRVPLLQHLADILAVKIKAIPEEICYWIEPGSRGEISRGFTFVRSQGADKRQKGLAHLYNKFITRDPHPLSERDQAMTEP